MPQCRTQIRPRTPRSDLPECGVHQIKVPWADPAARRTLPLVAHAIEVLQVARSTTQVCDLFSICWSSVDSVMKRAFQRGLERKEIEEIPRVDIDEKSFRVRHFDITTLCDLDKGWVIEVVEGRIEEKSFELLKRPSPKARASIIAVALAKWQAFLNGMKSVLPHSAIVHDRFDISRHVNDSVTEVRTEEHNMLLVRGDERLKGTRNLWLWNEEILNDEQYLCLLNIRDRGFKASKVWLANEVVRFFSELPWHWDAAKEYFVGWFRHTSYFKLAPIKKVDCMLRGHLNNLLTWGSTPSPLLSARGSTAKSNP